MQRSLLPVVAIAAFAVPTVAFAKHGADDGARTTSTSATTTQPSTGALTATQRSRAITAARARVGSSAKVVSVVRQSGAIRVRLTRGSTRYDVRVSFSGKVLGVTKKASDDGAGHDQGDDHGSGGQGADDGAGHA